MSHIAIVYEARCMYHTMDLYIVMFASNTWSAAKINLLLNGLKSSYIMLQCVIGIWYNLFNLLGLSDVYASAN